jgi:hypothetical protein
MANLSPFQKGYGSLQVFSVCQPVPSGPQNNFLLTGLRKDSITARAPGVFREEPSEEGPEGFDSSFPNHLSSLKRLPTTVPQLVFNVLDQGNLDNQSTPKDEGQEGYDSTGGRPSSGLQITMFFILTSNTSHE